MVLDHGQCCTSAGVLAMSEDHFGLRSVGGEDHQPLGVRDVAKPPTTHGTIPRNQVIQLGESLERNRT